MPTVADVPSFKAEATEVKFPGQASKFFDTRLVGAIQQELPGGIFAHFCILVPYTEDGKDKVEHITIGHGGEAEHKKGIMTAEAQRPETMKALVRALEKYYAGGTK